MYFLPRRIGLVRAKELIFSGRTVQADEAIRIGIADRLTTPESLLGDARAWAAQLAQGGAEAVALAKSILDRTFELTPEAVFAQGSQAQAILYTTARHQEAIATFLGKGK
jgi:enoyl-CoA hydratase/carnithine racemase